VARRNVSTKARDSVTEALERSVRHEINFVYSIWGYEFERAFQADVAATEALSGGKELKPYRAFWHYTAAVAAYYEWKQSGDAQWRDRYRGEIGRSLATSMGVTWLPGLQAVAAKEDSGATGPSVNITEVSSLLEEWQIVGTKFERALNSVRDAINSDEASKFELGLKSLGRMLGCTSRSFDDDGAPDSLWLLADNNASRRR
jgi:hypothetical protein